MVGEIMAPPHSPCVRHSAVPNAVPTAHPHWFAMNYDANAGMRCNRKHLQQIIAKHSTLCNSLIRH